MEPDILVVDDDHAIRETVCLFLREEGYGVVEAANGQMALPLLRHTHRPLVVLLDQFMPALDGVGVLRAVASNPALLARHHAFILMTGSPRLFETGDEHSFGSLLSGIIAKPFDLDALLGVVTRGMDQTRAAILPRWDGDAGSQLDDIS